MYWGAHVTFFLVGPAADDLPLFSRHNVIIVAHMSSLSSWRCTALTALGVLAAWWLWTLMPDAYCRAEGRWGRCEGYCGRCEGFAPGPQQCDRATEFTQTDDPRCPPGYTNIGIARIRAKGRVVKRCQSDACRALRPETVQKA